MKLNLASILQTETERQDIHPAPTFAQALRKGLLDSGATVLRFSDAQGREYFCIAALTQDLYTYTSDRSAAFSPTPINLGNEVLLRLLEDHVPNHEFCSRPYRERA